MFKINILPPLQSVDGFSCQRRILAKSIRGIIVNVSQM
ncbi:hypothetical protein yinte0001_31600 [Yersinia intermedia ATCC 29909]|nr:hypothetical protein yinte0001_31600 [Yersinia intermedia ATCC 29909]